MTRRTSTARPFAKTLRARPAALRRALALALCLAFCLVLAWPVSARAKEQELVFGMSAAFSGPARGLGMEYYRGLMASFEHTNAQGGAGGWRLVLSLRDDGYDPLSALSNTIGFVEQERVFALLGYVGTPTTARVLPLLKHYEAERMVLLFPFTGADLLRESPGDGFVFNLRASYFDETRVLVEALYAAGKRRIAVFHQADVYGRNGWDGVRRALKAHGLSIVADATYRRGAANTQDFRREVGLLQAAKPDAIVTVGTAPACAAFIRDARDAGVSAPIATLSFADADNLVKFLLAQSGMTNRDYTSQLIFSQVLPCYDDSTLPAARLYRQVMEQARVALPAQLMREEYHPNSRSFVSFEGFLAGQVLAEAVRRMADAPTRARLVAVLLGMKGLDIGIGEKVHFAPGRNQGLRQTYLMVYRDGGFKGLKTQSGRRP
jgi:branched-chain amino acid transport system substrate-binding protein